LPFFWPDPSILGWLGRNETKDRSDAGCSNVQDSPGNTSGVEERRILGNVPQRVHQQSAQGKFSSLQLSEIK
jgi:hypothetical protein